MYSCIQIYRNTRNEDFGNPVKVGYIIDTSCGTADVAYPGTPSARQFAEDALREGVAAEKAGFDGVYVPGRHGRGGAVLPSPFIFLAALAGMTERVRLGSYVLVLPYYDPRKVAEETAMLDLMSGGRLTLGVGRGGNWEPEILEASGVAPDERTRRFVENIRCIKQFWDGKPVTTDAAGLHYQDATTFPRPVQEPRPPIWIGAMADSAITRAAELGDAWVVDPFPIEINSWRRRVALYREAAERHGKTPRIVLMRDGFMADTREEAERVYGSVVVEEYRQYWDWGLFAHVPGFESKSAINIENLSRHMAIGTANDCVEDLEKCRTEYEADYVVLCSRRPAGPPSKATRESIAGFGSEVLPQVWDGTLF